MYQNIGELKGKRVKKINLALGIHNHQPVGNFDFVFEEAYERAYLPFLGRLQEHPDIKIALHYSGILFEWILERHPDFVGLLRGLVDRGQVEMMTGGFYEPIMITIPDEDKLGQIEKLTKFVKEHTGYDARGMWLAERIWEPHLPTPLAKAAIQYAVVDDSHFKYAGLRDEELFGYYVTESEGATLRIFPISEKLRYTIPFQEPEETIEYLHSVATEPGDRLVVFADDGEKFGVWPNTHKHCYKDRWVERFFAAIEENSEWINLLHFSEVLQHLKPAGRAYLPTASYREMMEWALPAKAIHEYEDFEKKLQECDLLERYKVFVRGGFWRNFLAKYPEANNLHKKMLRVSRRVSRVSQKTRSAKVVEARDHLWAGQCNCPYWHGVFGGLYLNNLRYAVYHELIQAEALLDQIEHKSEIQSGGWVEAEVTDFDGDGRDEVVVESRYYNLYFVPDRGGALFEMDYKPKAINVLDTMTRREEGYHDQLSLARTSAATNEEEEVSSIHHIVVAKEEGLERFLNYDWYRRSSFIDHFLAGNVTLEDFANGKYDERGDFVTEPFDYKIAKRKGGLDVNLRRQGRVLVDGAERPVEVVKRVFIPVDGEEITAAYILRNLSEYDLSLWFGVEFNFGLQAGNAPDRYYHIDGEKPEPNYFASSGKTAGVNELSLTDEWRGLRIALCFDKSAELWRFPIETISQSEGGFERVYQNSVVFPNWRFLLKKAGEWRVRISTRVAGLESK